MKHWRYALALAGVIGIGFAGAAFGGQVPNPINAPTSPITAGAIPYWTTTNAQQPSAITPVNNAIVVTNGSGVPSESTSLPSGVTIPLSNLAAQAANTVVGNATGGSASPTAVSPQTARSASLLNIESSHAYTWGNQSLAATDVYVYPTGTASGNITYTLPAVSSVNPGKVLIIADPLGKISGTTEVIATANTGDTIEGVAAGSNGAILNTAYSFAAFYADGSHEWADVTQIALACATHQVFTALTKAGGYTCAQLGFTDISGSIADGQQIAPSVSTWGSILSISCPSHQWVDVIPTSKVQPTCAQPAAGDVSGLGSLATLSTVNNSNWSGTALAKGNGGTGSTTGLGAASVLSVPYVICEGVPNFSHTGDTNPTQMNSTQCKITASTLATGNVVRIWALWSATGTNSTKTVNWVWGTANGTSGTSCFGQSLAAATNSTGESEGWVGVTGSSAEKCYGAGSTGTNSSALSSLALATGSDIYVNFTAQLGNSSDTVVLVAYVVEIMQSAGN